jgi:hypothetical protein
MLAYLVLAGNDGAPVDEGLISRFDRDDLPDLPFEPAERIVWRNQDGGVVFIGWQAFTDFAGIGSHWVVDDRGLTAFSGHCWPRETGWDHRGGQSWATYLRAFLRDHEDLLDAREALYGQFTLIDLPSQGAGSIVPDFANVHQLFFARQDAFACISNRAGLCARAVTPPGTTPARSLSGAGWLISEGWMLDDETGYWDVERPPFGSHISIDPTAGAKVRRLPRSPLVAQESTPFPADYAVVLDEVERDLRSTMRAIAALPIADREFCLSGGKDSRMLLGVILSEGLEHRFHFVTQGPPERADVRSAQQIAARFGLDWRNEDLSDRTAEDEMDNVLRHTAMVEGLTSAWSASQTFTCSPGATIKGIVGESLRWGRVASCGIGARTERELLEQMQQKRVVDPLGVLRPEAREYYRNFLADWVHELAVGGQALESISAIYTHGLLGYTRNAPLCTWSPRLELSPFISPACARANHRLAADKRPDPRFPIDLLRRCSVELSKLPLAATPWTEQEIAHLPDAEDYRRVQPLLPVSSAASTWRVKRYGDYRPMVESYLLDPENPIHALVDAERLAGRIATGDAHPGRTRLIWGALTASVWMGRHERPTRIVRT